MIDYVIPLALAIYAFVTTLRKLPPVERRVLEGRKPWACDVCMSVWTALATFVPFAVLRAWEGARLQDLLFLWLWTAAAAGLAMLVFWWVGSRVPKEIDIPDPIEREPTIKLPLEPPTSGTSS